VLSGAVSHDFTAECRSQVRIGQHLVGRPVGKHHPLQQQHTIAASCLLQVVRRHHHQMPGSTLGLDDLENGRLAWQVQAGDRLVEQQAVIFRREHHRHHHSLTLTPGEFAERFVAQVRNVEPLRRNANRFLVAATKPLQQPATAVSPDGQDLLHGHRHEGMRLVVLAHKPHSDVAGRLHSTRRRALQPAEHPQQGGLAAPVRTHQCNRRCVVELQVACFEHVAGPERDTDIVEMEQVVPHFDFTGGRMLKLG